MDPLDIASIAASGLGSIFGLFQQGQQSSNNAQMLALAQREQAMQELLAQKQLELSMAPRTDARGNTVYYMPGVGWQTSLSPTTQAIINSSDALTRQGMVNQLGRGELERSLSFNRRLQEGAAADPLLRAVMNGYGAPTKAGVGGTNAVADATAVGENADNMRRGFSAAALRTGGSTVPLSQNLSQIDRAGTAGLRSSLARSDANADPLFQSQLRQFQAGKLDPYNMLATRAGNSSDVPFQPENLSSGLDAAGMNAAYTGASKAAGGSEALYRGEMPVMTAYGNQTTPNYGLGITSFADALIGALKKNQSFSPNPTINRTSSTQTYF